MPAAPTIVWFRDDLRVGDHPALAAAAERGAPVVCVFVLDEESHGIRPLGGAARWWLHGSLEALRADLEALGTDLVLRRGPAGRVIRSLVDETGADAVFWNRRYGGPEREVDTELKSGLGDDGLEVKSFDANLLFEPWTIRTGQGTPYSVFTPFWRACLSAPEPRHPLAVPDAIDAYVPDVASDDLASWHLLPTRPDWAAGLRETWTPGSAAAHDRLAEFLDERLGDYDAARDRPAAVDATSRLSPHLRWGEISPFEVWHAVRERRAGAGGGRGAGSGGEATSRARFLAELGWREFAWHVLFHAPDLATRNWRAEFDAFPWPRLHPTALRAWEEGRTGVPLVDAGMRELWRTGSMHNRVRMVTASFLTKNLLIDWRRGEQWFWDTLVDADAASNPFNWQWVAGSGADAAPYFRVFNPLLQAKKFDPRGDYVRRWVPEADGDDYPEPIVDLGESRAAALAGYQSVKAAMGAARAATPS
ncbi:deoxyribodipyrimidine photo-lyase [Agromyces sp. CF514]|uniref:cryptochrome/photolyase family protein n=1 Tax=Agromyces sp. CF514 TaxID=1881031 RepID=UPI0008E0D8F1|nr:deoxyribodipyrimidine photo-lyase [Agromyces sp. CF514]SFR69999.1 deoxyribodipyrimidine photo-lyase [Agromyces sp. CF514]